MQSTTQQQRYSPEMRQKLERSLRICTQAELEVYQEFFQKRAEAGEEGLELVKTEIKNRQA